MKILRRVFPFLSKEPPKANFVCFIVHARHKEVKTAERPIQCFKLVIPHKYSNHGSRILDEREDNHVYYALWQGFRYVEGHTYDAIGWEEKTWGGDPGTITFGFHSYSSSVIAHHEHYGQSYDTVVVEYEIPVGARYYYNPNTREYVSNKIKCVRWYPIYLSLWDSLSWPVRKLLLLF